MSYLNLVEDVFGSDYFKYEYLNEEEFEKFIIPIMTDTRANIIKLRYGLFGNKKHTMKATFEKLGIEYSRGRDLLARAISDLRHPSGRFRTTSFGQDEISWINHILGKSGMKIARLGDSCP